MTLFSTAIMGQHWSLAFIKNNAECIFFETLGLPEGLIYSHIEGHHLYLSLHCEPNEFDYSSNDLDWKMTSFMNIPGVENCLIISDTLNGMTLWSSELDGSVDFRYHGITPTFLQRDEMTSKINNRSLHNENDPRKAD